MSALLLPANARPAERVRRGMVERGMHPPRTIGWLVDPDQRVELLQQFAPAYPQVVAHHVTLASASTDDLPADAVGEIVGTADDGSGVQALVVAIGGSTDRPGGGTFHISWSLGEGRRARESNDVIAARGWTPVDLPVPVTLIPSDL